jgi:TatA/E family protein of Tat protein translocase
MTMRREDSNRMGNLGMPELLLILVLALLLFGPKKLPEIGRQLGKGLGEFKRASNDLKRSIEDEIEKVSKDEPSTGTDVKPYSPPATAEGTSPQPKDTTPNHPA